MPCALHCFPVPVSVFLPILAAWDVAFFLILLFLLVSCQKVTTILFLVVSFVVLIFEMSFVSLVYLLLQLLVALGESLNCCGQGLHLSLQGIRGGGVPCFLLMVAIDHVWTMQLFVLEAVIWIITCQLMMYKDHQ